MDIATEHSHIGCHSDKWPRDVSSVKCYHGDLNTQMGIIESFNIVTVRSGLWVVVLILHYVALNTKPESRDLSHTPGKSSLCGIFTSTSLFCLRHVWKIVLSNMMMCNKEIAPTVHVKHLVLHYMRHSIKKQDRIVGRHNMFWVYFYSENVCAMAIVVLSLYCHYISVTKGTYGNKIHLRWQSCKLYIFLVFTFAGL